MGNFAQIPYNITEVFSLHNARFALLSILVYQKKRLNNDSLFVPQTAVEDLRNTYIMKHAATKELHIASRQVPELFLNISKDVQCILNKTMKYIKTSIVRDIGTCTILPVTQKTVAVKYCQEGIYVIVSRLLLF